LRCTVWSLSVQLAAAGAPDESRAGAGAAAVRAVVGIVTRAAFLEVV